MKRWIIVALAISVTLITLVLLMPYFATTNEERNTRRIVVFQLRYDYETKDNEAIAKYAKVTDLKPNSDEWFLDPFGKTMSGFYNSNINSTASDRQIAQVFIKADAFERYHLIRLPEWLGDSTNDISAYRAYSALDISIQSHCLTRYSNNEARWRIEDPCSGDIYRVWDGFVYHGPGVSSVATSNNALPRLRLSVDNEGYIIAHRLDNRIDGDGVVGEGRKISPDEIIMNDKAMIDAISEYVGYQVPIPVETFPGNYLISIGLSPEHASKHVVEAFYGRHEGERYDYGVQVLTLDDFPELDLKNNPAPNPDIFAEKAFTMLNVFYGEDCKCVTKSGYIEGSYYMMKLPDKKAKNSFDFGAMLIWGKSSDGKKEVLIEIQGKLEMDEFNEVAKSADIITTKG